MNQQLYARLFIFALLILWPWQVLALEPEPGGGGLLDQERKMERLKRGIAGQASRIKAVQAKENTLSSELERLNRQIQTDGETIAKLKDSLLEHETLLALRQQESEQARREQDLAKGHVQKRLAARYQLGPLGSLNILFAKESLPEILVLRDAFERMLAYDKNAIRRYRQTIAAADEARHQLEEERALLLTTMGQVKEHDQQLATAKSERLALLNRVRNEKKLYQGAMLELEKAAGKLTSTLKELQVEAGKNRPRKEGVASGKARPPENTPFASRKGRLSPPVPGTVITLFGKGGQGKFGPAPFANGIDIKASPGADIVAVHEGVVVFAGFLRGYGNLLIIDHDQQYFTLVSRAARFSKREGERVARDEVIGRVSDQGGLLGEEGVHFEIRNGTKPENPLRWLNRAKLTIAPDAVPKTR